ncbi:MAG TPA: hypothetical protein VK629_20320 [Steroidobacteraceae bacterium]|nr:hypothetical protein [Steroidobacteraceae bacterium]
MKTLIATPLHSGTADREFITGLLAAQGLYAGWMCLEGHANICRARDLLAAQFLATDCDSMIFIDGDVGFSRQDMELLLASPFPLTAGLYRRKNDSADWVCHPQPHEAPRDADYPSLARIVRVGTGFLRIDRKVFETLAAGNHINVYANGDQQVNQFFPTGLYQGEFLSEDYYFCELAAKAGFSIYVDTRIKLKHVGRRVYQE